MTENELLKKFEVEELEKRYEMAWIKSFQVDTPVGSTKEIPVN